MRRYCGRDFSPDEQAKIIDLHDFQSKHYEAGLLREETLYDDQGIAAQYNTLLYTNGRCSNKFVIMVVFLFVVYPCYFFFYAFK